MREPVVFITGASGEIGHGLISRLKALGDHAIVTLDLKPMPEDVGCHVTRAFQGSINDKNVLDGILAEFEVDMVFHLAALLSTRSELIPVTAHQVNVEGTLNLLEFAQAQAQSHGRAVRFLYPSSIAAYGMPDLATKAKAGKVREEEWNLPSTMYGCNKLYCEHLGNYYSKHYRQLDADRTKHGVDFRSIRFPGLISAITVPSGGTSDYAPEMIHAAAKGEPYACFVREDTRIPFMAMPDAVDALVQLAQAERQTLTRCVYNIGAFNPSALEVCDLVRAAFPGAEISFVPDLKRQSIVDSWPEDVDDSSARRDWGLAPQYGLERAFSEYLIPTIRERYAS
ncbi:MAG: NAD-dependent epimerase/dehydratase family protein [Planctomycetes bacterium]|nr:NAD-dependent epimerase/dehydratase family protein [Planctomycetota bacterium]